MLRVEVSGSLQISDHEANAFPDRAAIGRINPFLFSGYVHQATVQLHVRTLMASRPRS